MNVAKLKGTHNAMKSGITAAESIFEELKDESKSLIFAVFVYFERDLIFSATIILSLRRKL